jgi:hypothetical protein
MNRLDQAMNPAERQCRYQHRAKAPKKENQ